MTQRISLLILACTLLAAPVWIGIGAAPVWAGIGDPLPENPCDPARDLSRKRGATLTVLDVSGGGCTGASPGVETVITCTIKQGKRKRREGTEDLVVEFFSGSTGQSITGGPVCVASQLAVGSTVTMVTGELPAPSPYSGAVVIPASDGTCGPGCFLHASARVFLTNGLLNCTATRVDLSEVCFQGAPARVATKNLTVIRPHKVKKKDTQNRQQGD